MNVLLNLSTKKAFEIFIVSEEQNWRIQFYVRICHAVGKAANIKKRYLIPCH